MVSSVKLSLALRISTLILQVNFFCIITSVQLLLSKMLSKIPRKMRRVLGSVWVYEFLLALVIISYLYHIRTILDNRVNMISTTSALPPLFSIPRRVQIISSTTDEGSTTMKPNKFNKFVKKCPVTIALILCEDDRYLSVTRNKTNLQLIAHQHSSTKIIARDFSRQINQTLVLLKSIAILSKYEASKSCVEVLLLSDKPHHYKQIRTEMRTKWSIEFQRLIKVIDVPVRYPLGAAWMKKMFRPCATLRLFLAELLPTETWGSVIYLDTDIIFFQSVQALWGQFERFNDVDNDNSEESFKKLAAMAPCLFHYGSSANDVPYFGSSGLNAGVMLMNLTRMRGSQWTNKIRMVTTMFKDKIKLADQDILNIYFHFFPEELHLLTCDWNFRSFQCREGSTCEDPEIEQGISVLHGNALSFTAQGPEPLFHAVFQTYHRTKLDKTFELERFVKHLESTLVMADEAAHKFSSQCKRFGGLDVLLLNRLYSLVERRK